MAALKSLDVQIGHRIKRLRNEKKMTQEKLAAALHISFQQIQKYERGLNRVGASRLYEISQILNVPIGFFYHDLRFDKSIRAHLSSLEYSGAMMGLSEDQEPFIQPSDKEYQEVCSLMEEDEADMLHSEEARALVRAYYRIIDEAVRRQMLELMHSLAEKSRPGKL